MNKKDIPDMETVFPVDSLNQDADDAVEEVSSRVEGNHVELDSMIEPHQSQRTSTPSDENSAFSNGVISNNQHVPCNTVEFSPVLDSGDISDSMENSFEISGSLYFSAQSNMNSTDPLDGGGTSIVGSLADQGIGDVGNYSECATRDSAWETAFESEQEISVLKDVTVTEEDEEVESNDGPQGMSDFNSTGNFARTDDGSGMTGPTSPDTISNSAIGDEPNEQQSLQLNKSDLSVNLDAADPVADTLTLINSPDLDLLNEICEEATSMTIKEALICSLKPGVRAGLSEGRLQLSESDIMVLEQYCEHFIDNLFSDLVNKQWTLEALTELEKVKESSQPLEEKASMARKLSDVGLDTLKTSCDRFVQSIIRESIHNLLFEFQEKDDSKLPDDERYQQISTHAVLDKHSVEDILPIFQKSVTIQQYIGFLSADIIKSALMNLSSTMATTNAEKNALLSRKNNPTHFQQTHEDAITELSENTQKFWENMSDDEIWPVKIDKKTSVSSGNESCHLITAENISRDFDELPEPEMEELSDEEDTVCPNFASALETSLEFDTDDWEGRGLFPESPLLETGSKQRIVLRELSFDEHSDIPGTELLAPVFLAIAEENDDDSEFQGLRKKAQSIEDLCTVIDDKVYEKPRPQSLSTPKNMSLTQPMPDILAEVSQLVEEESELGGSGNEEGREDDTGKEVMGSEEQVSPKPSLPSDDADKREDRYRWHTVTVNKREKMLDLKLLEPYMKVISHGGYFSDTKATIVVLAACYLPERSIRNYNFLMEQLFFYVVSTLELLATHEDYYLVYLNGGTRQDNMPTVGWMKRFYQYIEGGLKKRMKEMFIVHPNFWLKTVIRLAKPFINSSFWRKLAFISSLESLSSFVPVDYIYIPNEVMRVDPAYRLTHNR